MSLFEILAPEKIMDIALFLPLPDIAYLCRTNSRFNEIICNNEYFWQQKFYNDYGVINYTVGSWKDLYKNYMNVWVFGDNEYGQL